MHTNYITDIVKREINLSKVYYGIRYIRFLKKISKLGKCQAVEILINFPVELLNYIKH